jgi:hypothetical protein
MKPPFLFMIYTSIILLHILVWLQCECHILNLICFSLRQALMDQHISDDRTTLLTGNTKQNFVSPLTQLVLCIS